jgi:uncharacterized protein YodC (DUF2158 family)
VGGELSRRCLAPGFLEALVGFRIEPKDGQEMRLDNEGDKVVLSEYRADGGLFRRTWFSRFTLRPTRVQRYDSLGRLALEAEMLAYERVGATDVCTSFHARRHGDEESELVVTVSHVGSDGSPHLGVVDYHVIREARGPALAANAP